MELVRLARKQDWSLTGPDGLLEQLTKTVLETALNEEMTEHLGCANHGLAGRDSGNVRNGKRGKTVLTECSGQVDLEVPRDRAGTFEPQIVKKRQRRLSGVDEMVLSWYAKGLTNGEISAHFAEIYGATASSETISRITDNVLEEMAHSGRPGRGWGVGGGVDDDPPDPVAGIPARLVTCTVGGSAGRDRAGAGVQQSGQLHRVESPRRYAVRKTAAGGP